MPPVAFPNPIPSWVRGAWHTVDTTLVEPYVSLLQYIENLSTGLTWRRCEVHWHNTASGAVIQDDMWTTFDILNITGGLPDSTWTTTDFTNCETQLDSFFSGLVSNWHGYLNLTEYKWYVREFAPLTSAKPFLPHGPPVRITPKTFNGTSTTYAEAQQCLTFTKRTAWSKHWGRNYIPWGGGSQVIVGGRLSATITNSVATAYGALLSALAAADFQVVVPSVQIDKSPSRQLLTVSSIQVDDILDVQRRRRPRNAVTRAHVP